MQKNRTSTELTSLAAFGVSAMMLANAAGAAIVTGSANGLKINAGESYNLYSNLNVVVSSQDFLGEFNSFVGISNNSTSINASGLLASGTELGPNKPFPYLISSNTTNRFYQVTNGKNANYPGDQSGIYGFQNNLSSTKANYGWVELAIKDTKVDDASGFRILSVNLNRFAYGTEGETLFVPNTVVSNPVPEPETLGLLAAGLGLVSIVAKRRRQQSTVVA